MRSVFRLLYSTVLGVVLLNGLLAAVQCFFHPGLCSLVSPLTEPLLGLIGVAFGPAIGLWLLGLILFGFGKRGE